jgi:hypothetical protein
MLALLIHVTLGHAQESVSLRFNAFEKERQQLDFGILFDPKQVRDSAWEREMQQRETKYKSWIEQGRSIDISTCQNWPELQAALLNQTGQTLLLAKSVAVPDFSDRTWIPAAPVSFWNLVTLLENRFALQAVWDTSEQTFVLQSRTSESDASLKSNSFIGKQQQVFRAHRPVVQWHELNKDPAHVVLQANFLWELEPRLLPLESRWKVDENSLSIKGIELQPLDQGGTYRLITPLCDHGLQLTGRYFLSRKIAEQTEPVPLVFSGKITGLWAWDQTAFDFTNYQVSVGEKQAVIQQQSRGNVKVEMSYAPHQHRMTIRAIYPPEYLTLESADTGMIRAGFELRVPSTQPGDKPIGIIPQLEDINSPLNSIMWELKLPEHATQPGATIRVLLPAYLSRETYDFEINESVSLSQEVSK